LCYNCGCIPSPAVKEIFEHFFTPKDEGQGTGLGLTVSHGIVKDHDGWIEVQSPPQGEPNGTSFSVFLPIEAPALAPAEGIGNA
jgi:two-component system NtrC family sensor kinase